MLRAGGRLQYSARWEILHRRIRRLIIWSSQVTRSGAEQSCESQTEIFRQLARRFRCGNFLFYGRENLLWNCEAMHQNAKRNYFYANAVCCRVNYPEHCRWLNQGLHWVSERGEAFMTGCCVRLHSVICTQISRCYTLSPLANLAAVQAKSALVYLLSGQQIWGWRRARSTCVLLWRTITRWAAHQSLSEMDLSGTRGAIIFVLP